MTTKLQHFVDDQRLPATSPFCDVVMDDQYAFIAGRVAADLPGHENILGDVFAETTLIMESFKVLLKRHDLSFSGVVQTTVHLTDLNDMPQMDKAYGEFFDAGKYPARTCIESPKLFGGSRVEITLVVRRR